MMSRTQEDTSEKVLRLMLRVPEITAKMLIAGLSGWLKRMDEREPIGQQRLDRLMQGNQKMEASTITSCDIKNLDADMKIFERMARQYGVGYTAVKISDQPGYTILFRGKNKEAYATLIAEYAKYQIARNFIAREVQQEVPGWGVSREPPLEGEILDETSMVVGVGRSTARKPDIILDTAIVLKHKESIEDRLQRARGEATVKNAQNQGIHQVEKAVNSPKRVLEPCR